MDQNNRIEKKVDKLEIVAESIKDQLAEMNTHFAVYNAELKIHIKRTELAEKKIEDLENRVEPLEKSDIQTAALWKYISISAAVIAFIVGTVIAIIK